MGKLTQIDLLRHGKLATAGLFCASPDMALSEEGLKSLLHATEKGQWDIIISSPSRRCLEFAKQLAEQNSCELAIDQHFQEMDFGDWTNQQTKLLHEQEPELFKQLWLSPDSFVAPNGESMQSFIQRVEEGWNGLLHAYPNRSILLITHAGVIRAIFSKALQISTLSTLKFSIEYAQISRIHYYPDGIYSLVSHGVSSTSYKTKEVLNET